MARTYDEYKAQRRTQEPDGPPLADYDPELSRTVGRGVPIDWPFCTCGMANCPDKVA